MTVNLKMDSKKWRGDIVLRKKIIFLKFILNKKIIGVKTNCSLKWTTCSSLMQSNVREPGENPGRLRHCERLQIPKPPATGRRNKV
jgi:hypothetical protein